MPFVRNALHQITHFLLHAVRKGNSKVFLQHESNASLAGLTVDPDHIRLILPSHILGINGKIRHLPAFSALPFLSPGHALGNGILMGTGKGGKHQISRIGGALVHPHPRQPLIGLSNLHDAAKIQSRLHAVTDHI